MLALLFQPAHERAFLHGPAEPWNRNLGHTIPPSGESARLGSVTRKVLSESLPECSSCSRHHALTTSMRIRSKFTGGLVRLGARGDSPNAALGAVGNLDDRR